MTSSPILPEAAVSSDASLLVAARRDPDAFRELYQRYAEAVHEYFVRRTGSRPTALDLTAETFAQAWLVRARFRDEAGLGGTLDLRHRSQRAVDVNPPRSA